MVVTEQFHVCAQADISVRNVRPHDARARVRLQKVRASKEGVQLGQNVQHVNAEAIDLDPLRHR